MDEDELLNELLSSPDYDYRQAFLDKEKPQYNLNDSSYHWASKTKDGKWLKSPNHPTAWKEVFVEQTGADPDGYNVENIQQADSILAKLGLGKTEDSLPKEWKQLPEFDDKNEKFFRAWLKSTKWFKQIHNEYK